MTVIMTWQNLALLVGLVLAAPAAASAQTSEADTLGALRGRIQHVIYIIKQGRTFDEVLGDITNGANADPALAQFGRHVTPNAHRIAANFVTFDNFFATSDAGAERLLQRAAGSPGLTIRNYGVAVKNIGSVGTPSAPNKTPFTNETPLAEASNDVIAAITDRYFRGPDDAYPDTWRVDEWRREFAQQVADKAMPALTIMRLGRDGIGALGPDTIANTGTPEALVADNDFAFARLVDAVAHSPYAGSTLIVAVEANSQNGPDHMDPGRSLAYFVGSAVAQARVISTRYTAGDFERTIEILLGMPPAGADDTTARPVTEAFDIDRPGWRYNAVASTMLRATTLLAGYDHIRFERKSDAMPQHDGAYWAAAIKSAEPGTDRFNELLWAGLNPGRPYPATRSGARMGQEYLENP